MVRRICEITVTLDFIFRLVLYSHEDVSFNIICLNVLEDIKQFYLLMWFKKNRPENMFKGDDVKALNAFIWNFLHDCSFYTFAARLFALKHSGKTLT